MPEHDPVYRQNAEDYHALVMVEDWQGNLLPAVERACPLDGLDAVELGAGTGRLTALIAPRLRSLLALDASPHMLNAARAHLARLAIPPVPLACADHRHLPLPSGIADLVIAGWSLVYLFTWHPQDWREQLGMGLAEMRRLMRPWGRIVLVETLGTGAEAPVLTGKLAPYYQALEAAGFTWDWVRTDYRFSSLTEARRLTEFFFGADMLAHLDEASLTLPECTGIWRRGV